MNTESKSELQLNRSEMSVEELHLALLQSLPDGMCFADPGDAVRFWNDSAETICGFSVAEAVCARQLSDVFFTADAEGNPLTLGLGEITRPECFLRHKDGHFVGVIVRPVPVSGRDGRSFGTLYLFTPLRHGTEESRSLDLSYPHWDHRHPALTHTAGVLLLQIDGFQEAARRLGPEATERLLALVENTAAQCIKPGDTCRRLEGGQTLITMHSAEALAGLSETLRALIQSARIQWWGKTVGITVSIGGSAVESHDTTADAIRRAENDVRRAALAGGNKVILSGVTGPQS